MKKIISVIAIINLILLNSFVFAGELNTKKNETVYVNLDEYGKVNMINAYNEYYFLNKEEIIDKAKYISYQNLTNNLNPIETNGYIKWDVKGLNRLSYLGRLSNEKAVNIPWNIDISYSLNGVDVNKEDILGKNGLVKVNVKINPNENANSYYKNNYLLEVTGSFDMSKYLSVKCDDATEVLTGRTKTLMIIGLPGQSKEFNIEIGSENFEFDGLTFAMLPLQGEIYDKINEIVKNKDDIENAMESLNDALSTILSNTSNMTSGVKNVISGTSEIKDGTSNINNTSENRNTDIEKLRVNLNELNNLSKNTNDDIKNLKSAIKNINEMLDKTNNISKSISDDLDDISDDLDELSKRVDSLPSDINNIKTLMSNTQDLLEYTKQLLKAKLDSNNFNTDLVEESIGNIKSNLETIGSTAKSAGITSAQNGDMSNAQNYSSIGTLTKSVGNDLTSIATELGNLKQILGSTKTASTGLISKVNDIKKDVGEIEDDLGTISKNSKDLPEYIDNLNDTIYDLNDGIKVLSEYTQKYLDNKENVDKAIDNLENMLEKTQSIGNVTNNLILTLQYTIKIIDNEIYNGATTLSDGMIDILNNTLNILNQTNSIKSSKDTIWNISKQRIDELTDKTNIFKIDPNEKVISFTSDENESPEKVEILLKSEAIKINTDNDITDIEEKEDSGTIWSRILNVFKKIFNSIISIFKKKD